MTGLYRLTLVTIVGMTLATDLLSAAVTSLPAATPAWLPGYKVRYPLHVAGDRTKATARTIMARLPTGGWAREDAADVTVQTAAGEIPRCSYVITYLNCVLKPVLSAVTRQVSRWL